MNRGALANVGVDAWTYGSLEVRGVAASGTPTDPRFDPAGDPIYNWVRYNVDLDRQVTAQYQCQTVGTFVDSTGADAWAFRLPVPAYRPVTGVGNWPLGTAMAYRSFTSPFINFFCTPVLAAESWPQLRSEPNAWFTIAVPNVYDAGTVAVVDAVPVSPGESTTVAHDLGYAPKAYDIHIVSTDTALASAATAHWSVQNIDTDSFDVVVGNVAPAGTADFDWKILAEPQTGNPYVGSAKPFKWSQHTTNNLFIQLRYEAA